ncbi:MAG: hypothetical protein IJ262_04790 [Clostridia bacterium]|nr:hypothetical protein [Clostridia bacterium]
MFDYIKMLIIALFSGIFSSIPLSSSLSFSFLNDILKFSNNSSEISFYYGIISIIFAIVSAFYVRKIYLKGIKTVFSKKKNKKSTTYISYKNMLIGMLVSFFTSFAVLIPISKERALSDILVDYIADGNLIVGAFCAVASGIILFVAIWYCRQKNESKKRSSKATDSLRLAIYQIPVHIFPGFSNVSSAAVSLSLGGVDDRVIMREAFIYISPSMFTVGVIRIVKALITGITIDPIMLVICVIFALIGNIIMFSLVSKINIRKSYLFFAILSIISGLFTAIAAFIVR